MPLALNLVGHRYGRLIVVERAPDRPDYPCNYRVRWLCRCDCGKEVNVSTHDLRCKSKRPTKSCGCLKRENNHMKWWRGCGKIGLSEWNHYKRGAIGRNLEFLITIEYAWQLYLNQGGRCAISGVSLVFPISGSKKNRKTGTASLDRIDSTKGYVEGNVQWVHKKVNIMKNKMPEDEFLKWCRTIVEHNGNNLERYQTAIPIPISSA